jgi:hypothetical protein
VVLTWLQGADRTWLIVLDDLADPAEVQRLWPDGPQGRTVVTTRRTDAVLTTRRRHQVTVDTFTQDQARRFLIDRLGLDPSRTSTMPICSRPTSDISRSIWSSLTGMGDFVATS